MQKIQAFVEYKNYKIVLHTYLSASDHLFLPHQFNIPEEWCAAFFTLSSVTPLCSLQCHIVCHITQCISTVLGNINISI